MAKGKSGYQIDMLHGPLAGKLLLFALPLMLSSLLQLPVSYTHLTLPTILLV